MFSTSQLDFIADIVCQYDYYVAYYYGTFYDYQIGEPRDSKILVYCSDSKPEVIDSTYSFSECKLYEITSNKYVLLESLDSAEFSPISQNDIVYTNCVYGSPQVDYVKSTIRTDAPQFIVVGVLVIACFSIFIRIVFGR